MGHNIPKIEYGGFIPSVILFDYPPIEDGGEQYDAKERVTTSISGKRQVSVDFVEAFRAFKFSHISEAILSDLKTFFLSHAYLGKPFKYFDDKDGVAYTYFELRDLKLAPKKLAAVTANTYIYEIPLTMRRVVDEEVTETMSATINNNQVAAANITGMVLDSTKYKSAKVFFELIRKTDSSENVSNGYLTATFKTSVNAWDVTTGGTYDGDATGVIFSILPGGQVQYVSDNQAGTNYSGVIKFRDFTFQ